MAQLRDRAILITGASVGLGKHIADAVVEAGADVWVCARNAAQLGEAVADLKRRAREGQKVHGTALDVSDAAQVKAFVEEAKRAFGRVDGLVNNAGVYGPMGPSEDVDWQAWVDAVHINLFGTVLLCREVVPLLRAAGRGKIVNLSGGGATAPQPRFSAYAASKAAVVRFSETLAEELRGAKIDVNAIAPGALNTRLLDAVLDAGPGVVGQAFYDRSVKQQRDGGAKPERAAALCTFLLSDASDGITGKLLSAVWDPWETLGERKEPLAKTDVYTLRRIVPKDRGLDWE